MILHFTSQPPNTDSDWWYKGRGWYFSDESEDLNGPYDTYELASVAQLDYAHYLNTGEIRHSNKG